MTHTAATQPRPTALHVPDWRKSNPYQALLGSALEAQGVRVRWSGLPQGLFPLNRLGRALEGVRIIHLHWSNDIVGAVVWDTNPIKRWLRLALLVADVGLIRLRGLRIVWTIHNLVTHESGDRTAEISARRLLGWSCNQVILHSDSALKRVEHNYGLRLQHKAHVIPHGNYVGIYPPNPTRMRTLMDECGIEADSIVLLFFGAIRAYKRVPQLVKTFCRTQNPKLRLVIAGNANPPELAQEIEAAAADDSRVRFRRGFVPDEDVAAYYDLANAVLIPLEQSLTSGSIVLAMTMCKATILHDEGRVFDLVTSQSGVFYRSEAELIDVLDTIKRTDLIRMGSAAASSVANQDWPTVAKATKRAYGLK